MVYIYLRNKILSYHIIKSKKKYSLIVTRFNTEVLKQKKVLLLSEWCRSFDLDKRFLEKTSLARPYGCNLSQKNIDFTFGRFLEKKLLNELGVILNRYHKKNFSKRFWTIILGHWLRRFVDVSINRVKSIQMCAKDYNITSLFIYKNQDYLIPTNSLSAIHMFNNDYFNSFLYLNAFKALNKKINVSYLSNNIKNINKKILKQPQNWIKKYIYYLAHIYHKYIVRYINHSLIINSYLPRNVEILLNLKLKQLPVFSLFTEFQYDKPDIKLRNELKSGLNKSTQNPVERFIREHIFDCMPQSYLENFQSLDKCIKDRGWPENPKIIFTSNNFDTDDAFKKYAAENAERGSKYICAAHGAYGVWRHHMRNTPEETTPDKFISWGSLKINKNYVPGFVLKYPKSARLKNDKGKYLLFVLRSHENRIFSWDESFEYKKYFLDQLKFVKKLKYGPNAMLRLRKSSGQSDLYFGEQEIWQKLKNKIKYDKNRKITKSYQTAKIVVFTYDSSGILETLSANIPTLAFWQNGFEHLRESAKPYYKLLLDAGIVHLSAESVAKKVNEVWNDVHEWWGQSKIQRARVKFCERYARLSENPSHDIIKIFSS